MKKILVALFAMAAVAVANAGVYKITKPTKAQEKEMDRDFEEGGDDCAFFTTNKGMLCVHVESPRVYTLIKAKVGECYNISGDEPFYRKAKKVKCPTNTKK